MSLYKKLVNEEEKLALVGLGYVGMPIAVAFAKKGLDVIGFDLNHEKINLYKEGIDPTKEVGDEIIKTTTVDFTDDETRLKEAKFLIVAVPTPINTDHTPDLTPVIGASEIVGRNLTKDAIVVYESTVYPGCTEDVCIPILERESGMKCGVDFKIGYSPERINPGDKVHRLENIHKIVSGCDKESLEEIKNVYDIVIEVGTHPVSNMRTAEAVKVVENSQRDINIAFMNELAMVFDRMDIDTNEVVDGMNTKWNALGFRPGLVGGHCIGVDPYYFTYEAEKLGYHSQIILNGRIVNDRMGVYVADATVKNMIAAGQAPKKSKVVILGVTFKENCPDTRNSKVADIISQLNTYGIKPTVIDPWANERDVMHEYSIELKTMSEAKDADCVIVAVAHDEFKKISLDEIKVMFRECLDEEKVLIDVKGLYRVNDLRKSGMRFWRL
jgi:UDP-N-acetyl-D-galactosamine dehydrogenase